MNDPQAGHAKPGWSKTFRRSTMAPNIWSTQSSDLDRVVDELGFPAASYHLGPGMARGADVTAIAFLDGGFLESRRGGSAWGLFDGKWVLGVEAMAWVCGQLGIRS